MSDVNPEDSFQIELSREAEQGCYSNLVISNFSQEEFFLDFAFIQPQIKKGKVLSRVILTPRNIKLLLQLLQAQIGEYESKYGVMTDAGTTPGFQINFN